MNRPKRTTVEVTEAANNAYQRMVNRYGVRSAISAALLLLDEQTPAERERLIDKANGIESLDTSEIAAESARFCIKKMQSLSEKDRAIAFQFLSDDESRAIKEMLDALNPEIQYAQHKRRKKTKGA